MFKPLVSAFRVSDGLQHRFKLHFCEHLNSFRASLSIFTLNIAKRANFYNSRQLLLLQDFNIEKLQLLESEKAKIRKEYERREGQIEVKKKM